MYEITYLIFIRYRGPFGLTIPLPRLRVAHSDRPMRLLRRFSPEELLA